MQGLTVREQLEGFPVFQMVIISLIRIAEPIAFTSMFPYIYFMIQQFGIAENDADISRYSGYLASAFSFCQFLCSVQWGKASESFGRKPVLLVGLCGTATSMIVFGFSTNFYIAFLARMMMGLLNGNVSVIRTTIGEIAVERRHQSIAFSSLTLLWSTGAIVGSWLGGVLTDTTHLPEVSSIDDKRDGSTNSGGLLTRYPFALSNIVVAVILCISILIGWLFFEETHDGKRFNRDRGLEVGDWLRKKLGFEVPVRPWQKYAPLYDDSRQGSELMNDYDGDDEEDKDGIELQLYSSVDPDAESASSQEVKPTSENYAKAFTWPVINTILSHFILSFHNLVYSEFLPVLLAGKVMVEDLDFPFKIKGGFGFSSDTIGMILSLTGIIGILVVIFIFPVLNTYFSTINSYRVALITFPISLVILPLLIFTLPEYNHHIPSKFFTGAALYMITGLNTFSGATAFSQIIILIHRASPKQHRALINGYTLSITALARCLAPIIWGYLISKFDQMGYGGVSWWLLACISVGGFLHSFVLEEYQEVL
ncbi:major facilitator superfamily domain-containing protein [Scheffersomyces xylosifermentans]|uniref:major facilitator superfamily domain-containing protein n=1 Tax=Scheffersomyces xylosifermentans TaxID=1304137 RepID=UPI00315C970C